MRLRTASAERTAPRWRRGSAGRDGWGEGAGGYAPYSLLTCFCASRTVLSASLSRFC